MFLREPQLPKNNRKNNRHKSDMAYFGFVVARTPYPGLFHAPRTQYCHRCCFVTVYYGIVTVGFPLLRVWADTARHLVVSCVKKQPQKQPTVCPTRAAGTGKEGALVCGSPPDRRHERGFAAAGRFYACTRLTPTAPASATAARALLPRPESTSRLDSSIARPLRTRTGSSSGSALAGTRP